MLLVRSVMTSESTGEVWTRAQTPLETARVGAGLSRDRLAGIAGISPRTIVRLEKEARHPQALTRFRLAAALKQPAAALFPINTKGSPASEPFEKGSDVVTIAPRHREA